MNEGDEWTVGDFENNVVRGPLIEFDCSSWVDTSDGEWTVGDFEANIVRSLPVAANPSPKMNQSDEAFTALLSRYSTWIISRQSDEAFTAILSRGTPTYVSPEVIAKLPLQTQVAFAARCARRAQPYFIQAWPTAPSNHLTSVDKAIRVAETLGVPQFITGAAVGAAATGAMAIAAAPVALAVGGISYGIWNLFKWFDKGSSPPDTSTAADMTKTIDVTQVADAAAAAADAARTADAFAAVAAAVAAAAAATAANAAHTADPSTTAAVVHAAMCAIVAGVNPELLQADLANLSSQPALSL